MSNIEKSAFRLGEYVGYHEGKVYRIRKIGGAWVARNQADANDRIVARTLAALSKELQK